MFDKMRFSFISNLRAFASDTTRHLQSIAMLSDNHFTLPTTTALTCERTNKSLEEDFKTEEPAPMSSERMNQPTIDSPEGYTSKTPLLQETEIENDEEPDQLHRIKDDTH